MTALRTLLSRALAFFAKRRHDADLTDEIQAHLDLVAMEYVHQGMPPEAAMRAARKSFGGVDQIKELHRDQRGWPFIDTVAQDLRYAFRTFRKNRGFTAVAVLTLALGIGANTAIFTLIDALMLRRLPVRDPQQLVELSKLRKDGPRSESFSYPMVRALAAHDEIFAGLCGFSWAPEGTMFSVGSSDSIEQTGGVWVSGGYYQTLGLLPIAGRLLSPDDDRPGAGPAAVISDDYWTRRFGRDVAAIGRALVIEGKPVTIVGVSPPGFVGVNVGVAADITLPLSVLPQLHPERADFLGARSNGLIIVARPRPGLSLEQVNARLAVVWPQVVDAEVPTSLPAARRLFLSTTLQVDPAGTGWTDLRRQFRQPLFVLMAVVCLVLLIACANVANLLLARATARQREIAVRLALGASRGRVVRQLLTESALLSAAGAVLGGVFAWVGSGSLVALLSNGQTSAIVLDLTPNGHLLVFTSLVAVSTTLLFGAAPAWRATSADPARVMNASSSRVVRSGGRAVAALVTAQVSISLVLLIGGGLFVRTLQNLRTLDRGFRHEGVLLVDVDGRRTGYQGPRLKAFTQELLAIVERVPGVTAASLSAITPLQGGGITLPIAVNGQPIGSGETAFNNIAPRYFETMHTPLVLGRDFTARDDAAGSGVAIVNEAFVQQYMRQASPLGQRISIVGRPGDREVVGVVKNAVYESLRHAPPPTVYAPYTGRGAESVTFEIYTPGSLPEVAAAIRAAIQPQLPGSPVNVRTFTTQVESSLAQERMMATLAGAFSALGLVLAGIGLYGLLAYTVARRTSEIGIRMALGAQRGQVLWLVMQDALQMLMVGAAVGLPVAWAASRLVSSMLFGLRPMDPPTIAGATAILMLAGVFAAFLPARRAARVDPMVALRHE